MGVLKSTNVEVPVKAAKWTDRNATREDARGKRRIQLQGIKGRMESSFSGFLRVCIIGLLVLLQMLFLIILPYLLGSTSTHFYVVMELLSIVVILSLVNDNRSMANKMAWLYTCMVLPISGHIMYALWGRRKRQKKLMDVVEQKIRSGNYFLKVNDKMIESFASRHESTGRMSRYMGSENFPLFKNNQVEYYPMGEDAFEAMFVDIEKAQRYIFLDFFIVAEGALWDQFHEILLEKVKQGVEVWFLYDDFGGTLRTGRGFRKNLEEEGFRVQVFNPIHKYMDKLYMNYRNHQKIVVIDGNVGYTGGFNIADEYANLVDRFGVWKDTGVRLEGDGVWGLTVIFLQMWSICAKKEHINYDKYRPTRKFEENEVYCHIISDGPQNNPDNPMEAVYRQMVNVADEYLYVMTPYLVIESSMQEALIEAVQRGVDVRILTPYVPDKKSVKWLTNYYYGLLIRNGVRIFEYKPGFLHAKSVVNEDSAIVGTANMDYRSFNLHYENGVWVSHSGVVKEIYKDFRETMKVCQEISYDEWLRRPIWLKIVQHFLNVFAPLI